MTYRRSLPALLLALGLALPGPAQAYTFMTAANTGKQIRWTALPMKFNINTTPPPGVSSSQFYAAIRAAYKTWTSVSCSYFSTSDLGLVSLPQGDKSDLINTHVYRTSTWPFASNALGVTQTYYDGYAGKILDADTHYNPNVDWGVDGSSWVFDLQAVATHEIGHQLGLDHSQEQNATMFYATGQGDTSERSLHSDDIAGICAIYPTGTTPPPECTVPEHCAPNETCQNGTCVNANVKGYGSPCASGKECESGVCLQAGTTTFCSVLCGSSSPCPGGDQCLELSSGDKACLPNSASWGTRKLGDSCQSNMDCTTKICVNVPSSGYLCSQSCDPSQDACPSGFYCANTTSGGGLCIPGSKPEPPPPPPPKAALGEACSSSADCTTDLCAKVGTEMVCVQWCDDSSPCPSGFNCVPAGAKKVCLKDSGTEPPPPDKGSLGDPCSDHAECESGICGADGAGNRFCTELCDPQKGCATGFDCVPAGGENHACLPSSTTPNTVDPTDVDGGGGGCSVSVTPTPAHGRWLLLIFALPMMLLLRRRRR